MGEKNQQHVDEQGAQGKPRSGRAMRIVTDSASSCDLVFERYGKRDKKSVNIKLARDKTKLEQLEYKNLSAEAERRKNDGEGNFVIKSGKLVNVHQPFPGTPRR